jgi:hypothetical protein
MERAAYQQEQVLHQFVPESALRSCREIATFGRNLKAPVSDLTVEPPQVVLGEADRDFIINSSVRPVPVVAMQPGGQVRPSLS